MRSLHLVTSKVLHQLFQMRGEVTAFDMHNVFSSVGVIQNVLRQGYGGRIRRVELLGQLISS